MRCESNARNHKLGTACSRTRSDCGAIRVEYALSGTEVGTGIAYLPTGCTVLTWRVWLCGTRCQSSSTSPSQGTLCAYARGMRCAVLTYAMRLRAWYAMRGTEIAYGATRALLERMAATGVVCPLSPYAYLELSSYAYLELSSY
eukprot:283102-Rhodomonas_salina.1